MSTSESDQEKLRCPRGVTAERRSAKAWLLLLLVSSSIVALSGCVNLDDVAQLTGLANAAQRTLPAVVADISATCQRQNALLQDIPSDERPPNARALNCKAFQDLGDHLTKDQDVLINYFDALGRLASGAPLSYGETINANVKAIAGMSSLSSEAKGAGDAAQTLAKLLADAVTSSYRRHKVDSLIEKADPAVQQLAADLEKVVGQDYFGILHNEGSLLDTYYKSPLAAAGKCERLAFVLVERQYEGDCAALHSREAAAVAYQKVMASLAVFHAKLAVEAKSRASLRQIAEQIGPDLSDLKDALTQLQAASR